MPIIIIDRLPLPNFKTYVALSIGLFSIALYHGLYATNDPGWKSSLLEATKDMNNSLPLLSNASRNEYFSESKFRELVLYMLEDSLCFWGFINGAYCFLVVLAKCIQVIFVGDLRSIEVQHLKDKFYTFVFYKFIFIFGIINVQFIDEVLFWLIWFSIIGFLQLVSQLCKDRFEYLSQSPVFLKWNHSYLIALLGIVSSISCSLFVTCLGAGATSNGYSAFTFMIAECVLLILKLSHTIIRYCFYLYDTWTGLAASPSGAVGAATPSESLWKRRGPAAYYIEFGFDLAGLIIESVHYAHMLVWVWANMFLSVASFMICMQLKVLYQEIMLKLEKHKKYRRVLEFMEKNYPKATAQDLAENSDKCPICWEVMDSARKLPCSHLFHSVCLQSWLEQDTSCPTCRLSLNIHNIGSATNPESVDPDLNLPRGRQPNHFFHFDVGLFPGSRYISWLPSFSVEVTHGQFIRTGELIRDTSQLDSMARQVQQMFPHFPVSVITEDLHTTRSIELTIENILDGRLVLPPQLVIIDDESPGTSASTSNTETSSSNENTSRANENQQDGEEQEEEIVENIEEKFSKGSDNREKLLSCRRDKLLREARRKYLDKLAANKSAGNSAESETSKSVLADNLASQSGNLASKSGENLASELSSESLVNKLDTEASNMLKEDGNRHDARPNIREEISDSS
uniref:E3 ubiquitin-protein ligase AMFR n=1 Tax=Cacopsylla melanoneura TaxID=428564 RepID=A0A8D9BV65_9HEMI